MMHELPYDLNRYFVRTENTVEIPLTELTPGIAHAVENANRFMREAYDGKRERRAPISVTTLRGGRYGVLDGNSTLVNAVINDWPAILAVVVGDRLGSF